MATMDFSSLSRLVDQVNRTYHFPNPLDAQKVAEVASRVTEERVNKLFRDLGEQIQNVKDPTAWVTSALRKAAGGGGGKALGRPGVDQQTDQKLRSRIGWLNGDGGGFNGMIIYDKVVEASDGIPHSEVMRVLKDVEGKKGQVKDPNAWVCAALRNGGGQQAMPPLAGDAQLEDAKLRKRIGWLNGSGGFEGAINYTKIMEAAGGLQFSEIFSILKKVEENRDGVTDPTAWVCAGLRKAAARGGGPQMVPQMGGWSAPNAQWMGDGSSFGAAAMDTDTTSKIHKRIKWLNDSTRFGNSINCDKVLEAASGLNLASTLEVLKRLEEKAGQVKDPTAWVAFALRKSGGGGGGGTSAGPPKSSGPAAKKTIAKPTPAVGGQAVRKTIAKPVAKAAGRGKAIVKVQRR